MNELHKDPWPSDPTFVRTFHHNDGWYFSRREDGTVVISAPDGVRHEIDGYSWASIVAAVSASGEDTQSYYAAHRFHISAPVTP